MRLDFGFAGEARACFAVAGGEPAESSNSFFGLRQDHELSMPSGGGWVRGLQPGSKVSMTIMRPPQHGQVCASAGSSALSVSVLSALQLACGTASNSRALAIFFAREPLASSP